MQRTIELTCRAKNHGQRDIKIMHRQTLGLTTVIFAFAMSAAAQTGTVPLDAGTPPAGLTNSSITELNGNVGIGTTNPQAPLSVAGTQMQIYDPSQANTNYSYIKTSAYTDNTQLMTFGTTYGYSHPVDALSIFNGNVGIGTTSPAGRLHINGNSDANMVNNLVLGNSGVSDLSRTALYMGFQDVGLGLYGARIVQQGYPSATRSSDLLFQIHGIPADNLDTSWVTPLFIQRTTGNVGIGTTSPGAKFEVSGNIKLTANSGGSITFQDGSVQTVAYTGVTCGADYAEAIDVSGDRTKYEPGDILVIDSAAPGKFLKSNQAYSTLVAGIYSTKPGFVGRKQSPTPETSVTEVPMAMVGRVPTKVSAENGPIKVGDLLVASSTTGYAMRGTDRSQMLGAVIGKALGSLDSGTGVIEVLVTLQ